MDNYDYASKVWEFLAGKAPLRRPLTYADVAAAVQHPPRFLGPPLNLVYNYCLTHNLPDLSCIVVNQETGRPGKLTMPLELLPVEQGRVYDHRWPSEVAPDEFRKAELTPGTLPAIIIGCTEHIRSELVALTKAVSELKTLPGGDTRGVADRIMNLTTAIREVGNKIIDTMTRSTS